jgi:hypothetical protein
LSLFGGDEVVVVADVTVKGIVVVVVDVSIAFLLIYSEYSGISSRHDTTGRETRRRNKIMPTFLGYMFIIIVKK